MRASNADLATIIAWSLREWCEQKIFSNKIVNIDHCSRLLLVAKDASMHASQLIWPWNKPQWRFAWVPREYTWWNPIKSDHSKSNKTAAGKPQSNRRKMHCTRGTSQSRRAGIETEKVLVTHRDFYRCQGPQQWHLSLSEQSIDNTCFGKTKKTFPILTLFFILVTKHMNVPSSFLHFAVEFILRDKQLDLFSLNTNWSYKHSTGL